MTCKETISREQYQERIDRMLERCEEAFDHDRFNTPMLGLGTGHYGLTDLEMMRRNAELFRRGGKPDYYWAVVFAHKRITGEDLPGGQDVDD